MTPPLSAKNLRSFGWLMTVASLVFLAISCWRWGAERAWPAVVCLAIAAVAFAALAVLAPGALAAVHRPWMAMARFLGAIMTSVMMTVFYFTLLVPFTLIRFKDPLRSKLGSASYWEPHKNPEPTLERFRRAF